MPDYLKKANMTFAQHTKTRHNVLRLIISAAVVLSACSSEEGERAEITVDAAPSLPLVTLVANQASNNISAFMINATSGVLAPVAGSP